MLVRRHLSLLAIFAIAGAAPVPGSSLAFAAAEPGAAGGQKLVPIPDFAGIPDFFGTWRHVSLPGFEPPASGPGPVTNLSRDNGHSNYSQLVGDYGNPILKPWAASVVKKFGEISLSGVVFPSPANSCWPEPVPFIYKTFGVQILQQPHQVTIMYEDGPDIRRVRMNDAHPAQATPSWYGDSIGHYEGDTLVIDTVATRTNRPYAMIDLYGTPYTEKLHVVERYRLIDYEEAKDALERDRKENFRPRGDADRNYTVGKYLQLHFTVEDDGAFTTPWTATITYGRGAVAFQEIVCAENPHIPYETVHNKVPTADPPDF